MNFDIYIFDMDGTLYNSEKMALEAANRTIDILKYDIHKLSLKDIRNALGNPSIIYYSKLFPGLKKEQVLKAREICNKIEAELVYENYGNLYEGVTETLERLKDQNKVMGLATNSCTVYMEAIVQKYNLKKYLKYTYCAESEGGLSKSQMIEKILRSEHNTNAVMTGDRKFDMEAAKANNIGFICCDFGYCDIEENFRDTAIIKRIRSFRDIIY